MKVSFAPLVVLFVSTALVDAIAEKQTQGSSSLTMETPATEMNAKEVDAPKNFEVESKESRPEDAEPDDEETTQNYSVSTVYTTITSTVTDCEALVTVCPEIGRVVTKTISLYTTICPETTSAPSVPLVTAPAIQDLDNISYLTKTVETTLWYTVTECPPQEADCFVGLEKSSVATYLDVQEMTYENPHTVNENAPFPTTTFSRPYVTGSPSNYLPAPQSNVTMPVVPHNPTYDGASAKNFDGFVMYLGLAVAATATLFLQGWY